MLKRTLIVLSMTLAIVIAVEPMQTVHGIVLTRAEWVSMNLAETSVAGESQKQESRGNGFLRALKAPFRALGRLFGKGKKDNNKLERISKSDAKKFESVPVQVSRNTSTSQASSPANTTSAENATPANVTPETNSTPAANSVSVGNATENSGFASGPFNNSLEALENVALDHLNRGRTLLNSHDLNGAISELSQAASANPKLAEASSLLGVAYWRKGLRDMAEKAFENALRINKNDPQILNNFGFLLYENGDYESATKYLKRAAKVSPNDPRIWNNLGMAQSERGHFDDAYQSFVRAQGEYKGHLNIAARLEHCGKTWKAIKHLEMALALQPNSPDVLAQLASLYDREDRPDKAQTARSALVTLRTLADAATK